MLLTSYLMLGLQLAATHLEDPFGYDLSDLDLDLVRRGFLLLTPVVLLGYEAMCMAVRLF